MKKFGLVDPSTNIVQNITIAPDDWVAGDNWYEYTDSRPAVIGGTWNGSVFILPKPCNSWILDSNNNWKAPITKPTLTDVEVAENKYYLWYEDQYQSDNTKGWVIGNYQEHLNLGGQYIGW